MNGQKDIDLERLDQSAVAAELTVYDENGVDRSLVRWMLSLTPGERLAFAESSLRLAQSVRRGPTR